MGAATKREPTATGFDFAGFKRAFESQDIEAWLSYFDDAAEWIEYRHNAPPASPNRMRGKSEIGTFLGRVKGSNVRLELGDEVLGPTRAAFCVTCTLPDGRRIIENVIVHLKDGKIVRQVDVEAWD
jgi:SnoaL-like domain